MGGTGKRGEPMTEIDYRTLDDGYHWFTIETKEEVTT